jgi:acetoin:2,6-dichlorophenolindophenol oxidoreductase subunit beta
MPWTKIKPEEIDLNFTGESAENERMLGYPEALNEALDQALTIDPSVFVMGQGVDDAGGSFGVTRGLHLKHGAERNFDTPLAEAGLTGIAMGAALGGMRPVYIHNRPDFFFLCLDQLVNHASKWHYMFNGLQNVPLVMWTCIGRGWGSGAQHSQALQGTMMQYPGLKFVMPSTAYDAKGLMLSAIKDNNPVVIMEHRANFKYKGAVPEEMYTIPIGKGVVRRRGTDLTIVSISDMVNESLLAAEELAKEGIDAEVVDLRSLRPLDEGIILESICKTGKLLVADSGWKTGGVTAEVSAVAAEKGFDFLKAPVKRVACPDCPTPSGYTLENAFYIGKEDVIRAARDLAKRGV